MNTNTINEIEKSIINNDKSNLVTNILNNVPIKNSIQDTLKLNQITNNFNIDLKTNSVPDQYNSGRCWIFASTNMLRHTILNSRGSKLPPNFDLSQAYVAKYDKIEKCLFVLESLFQNRKRFKIDDLEVRNIVGDGISDGGNWCMFQNIISKYGIMPATLFPDNFQLKNTGYMNNILKTILNKSKTKIYDCKNKTDFIKIKNNVMTDCIKVIVLCCGYTPHKFLWTNTLGGIEKEYTPIEFYRKIVKPIDSIVNLCYIPNYSFYTKLMSKTMTNMIDKPTICYNMELSILKIAAVRCLQKGIPVWISCKIDYKYMLNNRILDDKSSLVEELFDIDLSENKKDAIDNMNGIANHAMTVLGCQYDKKNKKVSKWKIQNSWGKSKDNNDGVLIMTDTFFDKFVTDICVHKTNVPEIKKVTKTKEVSMFTLLCI
jgi:bleomycin hydrolase